MRAVARVYGPRVGGRRVHCAALHSLASGVPLLDVSASREAHATHKRIHGASFSPPLPFSFFTPFALFLFVNHFVFLLFPQNLCNYSSFRDFASLYHVHIYDVDFVPSQTIGNMYS